MDRTPPEFSEFLPKTGTFVNNLDLGWTLSEDLKEGSLIVKNIKTGNEITIPLTENDLQGGIRALDELPGLTLTDGEQYNLTLNGSDFAGNRAESIEIKNITYDVSAPQISIVNPLSGQHLIKSDITYTTAEILLEADVVWIKSNSLTESYKINEKDLTKGTHILTEYWEEPIEGEPFSIYIKGRDRAGNTANSDTIENLVFDSTKPELAILFPLNESAVNHSLLNLKISEDLSSGSVIWEVAEGTDPEAPYKIVLAQKELLAGESSELTLSEIPALKNGVIYNLTFEGIDLAGNEAVPVTNINILYDISPPAFTELIPEDNAFIKEVNLSYILSENLREGAIIFENIDENGQPGPSQTVKLAGKRKEMGQGGGLLPASIIQLTSGQLYNIKFTGTDQAGNMAAETMISNVTFDNEKPKLDIIEPNNGAFVRSTNISYSISEKLVEAEFILEAAAESNDLNTTIKLSTSEMSEGDHLNVFLKGLTGWEEAVSYNLILKGKDRAGNNSEPAMVKAVTLDKTDPVITLDKPNKTSYINYETLSYTLSEQLGQAAVVFTQLSENTADQLVQEIKLVDLELSQGSKQDIKLTQGPNLTNGQSYRIEMNGIDRAGNQAETVIVEQVTFDDEAPEISLSMPIDGEQIQNTNISYIVSDDLSQAEAVLEQTGGTIDPLSPHRVKLTGTDLTLGMHADVKLNLEDKLADGG
ncbi:MAG: Ig-like domain-containing protein, partial [Candidatus Neomarinimicrobiota bacterium]